MECQDLLRFLLIIRFLLAQLHISSLAKKHNRRDVRDALASLPEKLNDRYDEMMDRICSQDAEDANLAKQVLSWILFAKRPLKTTELQQAIATKPGSTNLDEEALTDEDILVSVCAGIVTIDREGNLIRFVHYTVQTYFERPEVLGKQFPEAQTRIGTTCLTYLGFDVFDKPLYREVRRGVSRMERVRRHFFGNYAAKYWGEHIRGAAEEDSDVQTAIVRLFSSPNKIDWMVKTNHSPEQRKFLHVVAEMGLASICNCFLSRYTLDRRWILRVGEILDKHQCCQKHRPR
jgi:hypothetical protein